MISTRVTMFLFVLCVLTTTIAAENTEPYASYCSQCDESGVTNPCCLRDATDDTYASICLVWFRKVFLDWTTKKATSRNIDNTPMPVAQMPGNFGTDKMSRNDIEDTDTSTYLTYFYRLFLDWTITNTEAWNTYKDTTPPDDADDTMTRPCLGCSTPVGATLNSLASHIFNGLSSYRMVFPSWTTHNAWNVADDETHSVGHTELPGSSQANARISNDVKTNAKIADDEVKRETDNEGWTELSDAAMMGIITWLLVVVTRTAGYRVYKYAVRYMHAIRARDLSQAYDVRRAESTSYSNLYGRFVCYDQESEAWRNVAGRFSQHDGLCCGRDDTYSRGDVDGLNLITDIDLNDKSRDQVVENIIEHADEDLDNRDQENKQTNQKAVGDDDEVTKDKNDESEGNKMALKEQCNKQSGEIYSASGDENYQQTKDINGYLVPVYYINKNYSDTDKKRKITDNQKAELRAKRIDFVRKITVVLLITAFVAVAMYSSVMKVLTLVQTAERPE